MVDYFLPRQIGNLVDSSLQNCKNLGLILDKYIPRTVVGTGEETREKGEKARWLKQRIQNNYIDKTLAENAYQRWQHAVDAMHAIRFDARTDWRMVVGLGGETVLDTDLTLHHVYGIPFIPGSALKGLTRAYVTGEIDKYKSPKIENDHEDIQCIFGTQKDAGSVIFFDAMPLNGQYSIEIDIMNSHYPKYYSDGRPPANDQDPNPITFLTVMDTTFTFALAPRRLDNAKDVENVKTVQGWLHQALRDYGVGGKTSAGYGALTVVGQTASSQPAQQQQVATIPTPTAPVDPELNIVAGYIRELGFIGGKAIPNRLPGYYPKWQKLTSTEARIMFAKALVAKAREGIKEKDLVKMDWYKGLREFLDKA